MILYLSFYDAIIESIRVENIEFYLIVLLSRNVTSVTDENKNGIQKRYLNLQVTYSSEYIQIILPFH